jgi:hypothetical protein
VGTVITGLGDVRCKRCSVSFGGGLTRVENLVGEQIRTRNDKQELSMFCEPCSQFSKEYR